MYKQLVCSKIGKSGCYFLSLVYIAENITGKRVDIFPLYEKGIKEKWFDDECYMEKPSAMMSYLVGKKCDVRHDKVGYKPKENEYEITRYELRETGVTYGHFVVTRNGKLVYDPFGASRTRTKGNAVSTRIVKVL
jgi:hypothetical protein